MKTIIVIIDEEELRKNVLTTMNIQIPITGVPAEIAAGDTFTLSIFGNTGGVILHRKHWQAQENTCRLMCYGHRDLMHKLAAKGKEDEGGDNTYFLPEQKWG